MSLITGAKIEVGDPGTSLDLMFKAYFDSAFLKKTSVYYLGQFRSGLKTPVCPAYLMNMLEYCRDLIIAHCLSGNVPGLILHHLIISFFFDKAAALIDHESE